MLQGTGLGKDFLSNTPKAHKVTQPKQNWDHIKLKSFCTAKGTIYKEKRQPTDWGIICANYPGQGINN